MTTQKIIETNASILFNFIEIKDSNVECFFIGSYDAVINEYLCNNIKIFQKHTSFKDFLNNELKEQYQFVDMQDITIINETDSTKLFQRVRGKVKLILYDTKKEPDADLFKFCLWLRTYTWNKNSD